MLLYGLTAKDSWFKPKKNYKKIMEWKKCRIDAKDKYVIEYEKKRKRKWNVFLCFKQSFVDEK